MSAHQRHPARTYHILGVPLRTGSLAPGNEDDARAYRDAHLLEGPERRETILALEKARDRGPPACDAAEHDRAMRDGLVAGHAHLASEALPGVDPVALHARRHLDPVGGAGQPTALG